MGVQSIVVTGNCFTLSVGEALTALLPSTSAEAFPAWELDEVERRATAEGLLASADAWVRMPLGANDALASHVSDHTRIVDIPALAFPAFHPDLVYATRSDGSMMRSLTDYHSAIGLWAWRRGLTPEEATFLFRDEVMAALRYDAYWRPSVEALRDDFTTSSLEFAPFWLRLKRLGVFMHTVNHPRAEAIALLAKATAAALGAPEAVWDEPIERYLNDYLSHIVWPVYPFVAHSLGVGGCFRWRIAERQFPDLVSWLAAAWSTYEDVDPDDIRCPRIDDGVYDTVLEPWLPHVTPAAGSAS